MRFHGKLILRTCDSLYCDAWSWIGHNNSFRYIFSENVTNHDCSVFSFFDKFKSQKKKIKSFNPNKNCKRIFQQQIQNMFNEWWNVVLNYLKHTSIYKWQTQNESALQCGWIFYVLWLWAAIAVHRRIRCCCCYHFLILYEHRNTMRTMKQHIPVTPNSLRLLAGVTSHDFMTAFFLRASFYLP